MPSRRDTTELHSPNPRRHMRNVSAPTKLSAVSYATPVTPSSPNPHHFPIHAERSFSQSTTFASPSSPTPSSRANIAASKIITTVRKSFSHSSSKKRQAESSKNIAPLHFEEQNPRIAFTPSHHRFHDVASTRPTIEQIAMGLHVSRTPHLRSVNRHQRPTRPASDGSQGGLAPRVHPPAPIRSSLKKSSSLTNSSSMTPPATNSVLSAASMSTTTITSVTPSVAKSSRPALSLKTLMMTKFLSGARSLATDQESQESPSAENGPPSPRRKAVRFTSSTVGLDERAH